MFEKLQEGIEGIVYRRILIGNLLMYVFVSHLMLNSTLKCTTYAFSSLSTVKILHLK